MVIRVDSFLAVRKDLIMQNTVQQWCSARAELGAIKQNYAESRQLLDEEAATAKSLLLGMLDRLDTREVQTMCGETLVLVKRCLNNSARTINSSLIQDAVAQCTREDAERCVVACRAEGSPDSACNVVERALLNVIRDVGNVQTESLKVLTPKVQNAEQDTFPKLTADEQAAVREHLRLAVARADLRQRLSAETAPVVARMDAAEKLLLCDLKNNKKSMAVYVPENGLFRKNFLKLKTKTSKKNFGIKSLTQERIVAKALVKVFGDANITYTDKHLNIIQEVRFSQMFSQTTTELIEECRLREATETTVVSLNRGHLISSEEAEDRDVSASIILDSVN